MPAQDLGILAPPDWLAEHPELRSRAIVLEIPLKPFCVWRTDEHWTPVHAVKVIPIESEEVDVYEELHQLDLCSPNHTLPCDIIHSEHPFLIMPCLEKMMSSRERRSWDLLPLLDFFRQVIEGLEFLHERNIAHMDMYDGQVLIATEKQAALHKQLQAGKVYIIDYDASRHLKKGPGRHNAIELPETNCKPPLGMTRFDPYSWDVYCTGFLFQAIAEKVCDWQRIPIPWIVRRYTRWLIGTERGCTGVCHCRPSARRARQVICVVEFFVKLWERGVWVVSLARRLGVPRPAPS